ncbi:MarR family transcriptional regulator [Nesterenkonia sp. MY13]|uniref:MarR family transcriptional regulator n=2 Tax=Nesterenkonia sedimenti TaxID=1463632 RepID=A0A7X8TLH0_9MICC|nr:MarR family transcriptional regulator [Nesterenkonia sedimenti]
MEKRLHAVTGLKLADYNLLLLLTEAEDHQLRMGELAERMVFSPSRLSYQVKSLARRGLIERCIDENDKRGMTARLTDEGRKVFAAASKVHAQHIKQLFHPALDDAQAADLEQICEQIHQTVEQSEDL